MNNKRKMKKKSFKSLDVIKIIFYKITLGIRKIINEN
jgi:hypothetical protein